MIHLYLVAGFTGLLLSLYARQHDLRFLGGLTAFVGLVVALTNWGAW